MKGFELRPWQRTLLVLLALAVAAEGVALVVPHDHHEAAPVAVGCENPTCPDPASAHYSVPPDDHRSSCFACSLTPTSLAGPEPAPHVSGTSVTPEDAADPGCASISGRHRGPAARAPPVPTLG